MNCVFENQATLKRKNSGCAHTLTTAARSGPCGLQLVVLAAIDALELTDDITVTEDLALLLQHADEEIREAADEAIDFISDAEEE